MCSPLFVIHSVAHFSFALCLCPSLLCLAQPARSKAADEVSTTESDKESQNEREREREGVGEREREGEREGVGERERGREREGVGERGIQRNIQREQET